MTDFPIIPLPSFDYLHERLRYDPETGKCFWRVKANPLNEHTVNQWNSAWSGKEAGSINNQKTGQRRVRIDGVDYLLHRVLWKMTHGSDPKEYVDHIDVSASNNQIENLREASKPDNGHNTLMRPDNTSGYKGVTRDGEKWRAQIMCNGVHYYLGIYADKEEAHLVVSEARVRLHKDFARTK